MKITLHAKNEHDTMRFGHAFGQLLRGGEVFLLDSDLGGGKTTFTKGLVSGAGIVDDVSSPSFALSQRYQGDTLTVYHYDFYRLSGVGLLGEELQELLQDERAVIVVEWSRDAAVILEQKPVVLVAIDRQKKSENHRMITVDIPDEMHYLGTALSTEAVL